MIRALAALLLALLAPALAHAQTFPKFTGLVVDAANVLPADRKAALEAKLEAFQQQTKRQLVVATIPDLQGYPIEDYGYRLLRAWGVGLKDVNNGAILLVAPSERKVRIEVGYGLEPVLTDALSSVIINGTIVPAFKAGDMADGIEAGADAVIRQLSLPDDQAKAQVDAAVKEFDRTHQRRAAGAGAGVGLGVIFWVLVVGFIFLAHRRRAAGPGVGQRYQGGGGGSSWPIWLWAASELIDRDRGRGGWGGGDEGGGGWGGFGGGDSGGGGWGDGGFTGGGGGSGGGGGASGSW